MSENNASAPGRAPSPNQSTPPSIGRKCLRGPVPIDWLSAAARLPGRSLHVAIALWCLREPRGTDCIPLSNVSGLQFGVDRNAKYRGLAWLEGAGLVAVRRRLGRPPMVTLVVSGGSPERQF
jgi:hypothetical protein